MLFEISYNYATGHVSKTRYITDDIRKIRVFWTFRRPESACPFIRTNKNEFLIILFFRPERCSKKYERVFLEWDAMEHAFLQPCGFFDPDIYQGGPPRKGKIP